MSLLLSSAYNLFWLGRYMRRTQELADIIKLDADQLPAKLRFLGWPEMLAHEGGLYDYLLETALPQHFEYINDNVQAVRGVIDADAADLFNQIKRLSQAGSARAAYFQVYACAGAMLDQKTPYTTLFWQLGDHVEMLDCRIRENRAESHHYRRLADIVTSLPADTDWDRIKQQVQAMVYTTDPRQYYRWRKRLNQLFEEGV